jgi:hypothetical protein
MRKPEQRLYDAMKRNCVRLERIENGVNTGTPDVHCIRCATPRGLTVWIELKVVTTPKRVTTPLIKRDRMRRDQIAWHLSYASAGGRSFILARDQARELYLFPGALALELCDMPYGRCVLDHHIESWTKLFEVAFR